MTCLCAGLSAFGRLAVPDRSLLCAHDSAETQEVVSTSSVKVTSVTLH